MSITGEPLLGSRFARESRGFVKRLLEFPTYVQAGPMLAVPLALKHYLAPLLEAAEAAGFVGLVFVVARTIDAPKHHEQLSEHWASMHDVTGPLIGVIWPSGAGHMTKSGIPRPGSGREGAALTGFAIKSGRIKDQDWLLTREFWHRAAQDPGLMREFERNRELVRDEAPVSQKVLIDAWSTATADAADYFGLDESETPCLVVRSVQERRALVLPLGSIESIYGLFRSTRVALGSAPAAIKRLRDRREEVDKAVRETSSTLGLKAAERRGGIQRLVKALNSAPWLDRGVATEVRSVLQEALSSGEPIGELAALETLLQQLPEGDDQRPADRRKRKPLRRYEINHLREIIQEVDDLRDELGAESSESDRLKAQEDALLGELKLSEAILASYTGNRAAPAVSEHVGQGGLAEWKVLRVGAPGRLSSATTKAPG